jgi:magnesium-transporting ATPase (P-type)
MRSPEPWHAVSTDAVFETFTSGLDGLDPGEAVRRLAAHGPNRLPAAKPRSPIRRVLALFDNLLIYVLLASAAITLALGHGIDAAVILDVVFINAAVGFIQEGRAETALDAIRAMLSPRASVLRGGRRLTVDAEDLVAGDLVLVDPGDRVPADLRLVRARGLRIDEAALTGESVPAEKSPLPFAPDAALGDRSSIAFAGTLITAGQGAGVASPLAARPRSAASARWVGLAVAAIPEGLPALMTIALAIGVRRMAARHAIVRRLPAVETLGSVSIICTDKTGTMTRNQMTVGAAVTSAATFSVTGTGYHRTARSGKVKQTFLVSERTWGGRRWWMPKRPGCCRSVAAKSACPTCSGWGS